MAKNNQSAGNVSSEEIQSLLISIKAQDPQETAGALSLLGLGLISWTGCLLLRTRKSGKILPG